MVVLLIEGEHEHSWRSNHIERLHLERKVLDYSILYSDLIVAKNSFEQNRYKRLSGKSMLMIT